MRKALWLQTDTVGKSRFHTTYLVLGLTYKNGTTKLLKSQRDMKRKCPLFKQQNEEKESTHSHLDNM